MTRRAGLAPALLVLAGLLPVGCGPTPVDATYGRSRGPSINGTAALAELLRRRGHEVRAAVRLNETLGDWAGILVRFAPHPGPPDLDEGRWLMQWLRARPGRSLLYVPRDFDAGPEFWSEMIEARGREESAEVLDRLKKNRDESQSWPARLPPKPKTPAPAREWFAVDPRPGPPAFCRSLGGPWAEGVDAPAAAVSKHEGFQVDADEQPVLLSGDGSPLAIAWTLDNGSRVLAVANASFLLNASLLNRARRPLTLRVVDWLGPGPGHVAFVEGSSVLARANASVPPSSSPLFLFSVPPFGLVGSHVLAFLLILALAHAVRLGRPRPEPDSGVGRPSAHPEALGALLARTEGRADAARALLEAYRRWRHPSAAPGRPAPAAAPPPSSSPRA